MFARRILTCSTSTALVGAAAAWAAVVLSPNVAATAAPAGAPGALTGPYQLYCPGSVLGSLVFHARSKASLSPPAPGAGRSFRVTGFQVHVTFPATLATELTTFSPLGGNATASLRVVGAAPAAKSLQASFSIVIPNPVPAAGLSFGVPTKATSYGPFSATSKAIAVEMGSVISMALRIKTGGAPLKIAIKCTAFPSNTADFNPKIPWSGIGEPPLSEAISPVIALSS